MSTAKLLLLLPLLLLSCIILSATNIHAAVIAYEGFDYQPGTLAGNNGGTGFSGAWTSITSGFNVISPGLTFPAATSSASVIGNSAGLPQGGGGQAAIERQLTTSFGDSDGAGTYFMSFLMSPIDAIGGFSGVRLNGSGDDIFAGWGGNNPAIQVGTFGVGGTNSTETFATGETDLLVVKMEFTGDALADTLSLYVNPGETEPAVADAVYSAQNYGDISSILLQQNFGSIRDEIRIATSFEEAIGLAAPAAAPVPEPGSTLAWIVAFVAVYTTRRRLLRT